MTQWKGQTINLTARLVPKCMWLTASINVFIGEQQVLSTGGQLKILGSYKEQFTLPSGSTHEAELSYAPAGRYSFACRLSIDGVHIEDSLVYVSNSWMAGLVPGILCLAFVAYIFLQLTPPAPPPSP